MKTCNYCGFKIDPEDGGKELTSKTAKGRVWSEEVCNICFVDADLQAIIKRDDVKVRTLTSDELE